MSLADRIREILTEPTGSNDHTIQRRVRWVRIAREAMLYAPGDIAEIGAMEGDSTVPFCEIAEQFGQHVLAVDPWTPKTQNCRGHEYDVFMDRTARWRVNGVLKVLRAPSRSAEAIRALAYMQWAFALVDGLHKYDAVLSDVLAVQRARVICLDDMNMAPVVRAFDQALTLLPEREGVQDSTLAKKWEGYLV